MLSDRIFGTIHCSTVASWSQPLNIRGYSGALYRDIGQEVSYANGEFLGIPKLRCILQVFQWVD